VTRAIVATGYGGPEVLAVVDDPVTGPGTGEVLVAVRAAATNPADVKMYNGTFGEDPSRLPLRLGFEAAGVVTAVGDGATGPAGEIHVGDEVIVYQIDGAYAEEVLAPGSAILPKPSRLSFEAASGLLLTGVTAAHTLDATGVGSGDTVVIHGASGGVGSIAVQLAVKAGARVIGTAGEDRHDYLRRFGAEPVTYGDGLADRIRALAPGGVDAAIDAVGTDEAVETSIALVGDRDRIATIAAFQRGAELGIKVLGGSDDTAGTAFREAARLHLVRQAESGGLQVKVDSSYPMADVADAHRKLMSGRANGKVILVP
jgi:NADPH:quinone reductase-like Zn-dependent oxidoreductase